MKTKALIFEYRPSEASLRAGVISERLFNRADDTFFRAWCDHVAMKKLTDEEYRLMRETKQEFTGWDNWESKHRIHETRDI